MAVRENVWLQILVGMQPMEIGSDSHRCSLRCEIDEQSGLTSDLHYGMDLHRNAGVYYAPLQTREWL